MTIFGVSGGEAVDLALKMAFGHTGRGVVVVAEGAYHGNTGLSVRTGDAKFLAPFGLPGASPSTLVFASFNGSLGRTSTRQRAHVHTPRPHPRR